MQKHGALGHVVAVGLIRRGDELLLIRQHNGDGTFNWSPPGGVVEDGELVHEALLREVREECGLEVTGIRRLAYVSQHQLEDAKWGGLWTAFAFEIDCHDGEPVAEDPDAIVVEAKFVPLDEAIGLVSDTRIPPMRDPLFNYLHDQLSSSLEPRVWLWRLPNEPPGPVAIVGPALPPVGSVREA